MGSCLLCLGAAAHRHHVFGRARADGPYLDALTVPLCRRCHVGVHADWRALGIEAGGPYPVDRLKVLRAAHLCARIGALPVDGLGPVVEQLRQAFLHAGCT